MSTKNLWLAVLSLTMGFTFSACEEFEFLKENGSEELQGTSPGGSVADAVDMGTSVKWAKWNVGATKPEETGGFFAWAEPYTKDSYSWSTYKWGNDVKALTKYSTCSDFGVVDNKLEVEKKDDAASVNWGGKWRTPSADEWKELQAKCVWTWVANYDSTGVSGYTVASEATGNSIFLPAAGFMTEDQLYDVNEHGYYWSSSLYQTNSPGACNTDFSAGWVGANNYHYRELGYNIRPVTP